MGKTYGYARVSTREQNEARQILALGEFGVPQSSIFLDKQSGKNFDRPQYQKLIHQINLRCDYHRNHPQQETGEDDDYGGGAPGRNL